MTLLATSVAQQVVVTFSGREYLTEEHLQLSRIVIQNKTRGWSETLTYPDTVAIFTPNSGLENFQMDNTFALQQNVPNPFEGTTKVMLTTPEAGKVTMEISDINGRTLVGKNDFLHLPAGTHTFRIALPTAGIYLLTARHGQHSSSIKMVNTASGKDCHIVLESTSIAKPMLKKDIAKAFDLQDEMLYTGYTMENGIERTSYAIARSESTSEKLVFDFTHDAQPCQDAKTVTDYDKNTYSTVQIGKQCWMVENMRATHFADGTEIALNEGSSAAHRFIAGDRADMIQTCGYLYDWNAVKYTVVGNQESDRKQGVCPSGWHVPTQPEWIQLFGYVRSREEYICGGDNMNFAKALCANFGWSAPFQGLPCSVGKDLSTNNATGFTVVPAGITDGYRTREFAESARLWTATIGSTGSSHSITFKSGSTTIVLSSNYTDEGLSVRCVKD